MAINDVPEVLRFLEAERDRYVLEASDLERRLSFVRNQIDSLEALISGYALEDQMNQQVRRLPSISSSKPMFLESRQDTSLPIEVAGSSKAKALNTRLEEAADEEETRKTKKQAVPDVDISDIPKLSFPRKPGSLPLLPEFQEYSIQNAILIMMRRLPDRHIHVDAIVRDLYGDKLTRDDFKTAKVNVSKMLSTGTQMGMWFRVLDAQGVYTLRYEKGTTSEPPKKRR